MRHAPLLATAALLALAGPAWAQDAGSAASRDYAAAAAGSDAFEIMAARTVLAQSTDARVRRYAERMVAEHQAMDRQLAAAATAAGLQPPPLALGADQAPLLAAVQGVNGAEADRAYAQGQVAGHEAALATQRDYAATDDAAPLRRAAAAAVPHVAAHLAAARQLLAALGGS